MAEIKVFDNKGAAGSALEIPEKLAKANSAKGLVHQVAIAQLAGSRQGTASTKTRGEVKGSTAKVRRQKGTGRSRQGDKRVPHFRGGGVVHGPKPRDYGQATPRKMRQRAFATVVNSRAQNDRLFILDGDITEAKTKAFAQLLETLNLAGTKVLFLADVSQQEYLRSSRNLPKVQAQTVEQTSVVDVLNSDNVLCTRQAWELLEARVAA
jgi:large subunit ribosomal protein L4